MTRLLSMNNICKTFPGVRALENASLQIETGQVHALIGQNGAGKSTLIKILTGAYQKDSGQVLFADSEINFSSPQAAQTAGISTIYQEVNLIGLRSIAENIFLGHEPLGWGGFVNWKRMNAQATALLEQFQIFVDVTKPLGSFNIAVQQMTALARAVNGKAQLVVMDEPTSSLDDREVETLFAVIRELKKRQVSVLFVSHRLDELYAVCDHVTIMRDGKTVFDSPMQQITKLELVGRMLGKNLADLTNVGITAFTKREPLPQTAPLFEAVKIGHGKRLTNASFTVQPGEMVGLAGLLGAGRSETARVIFAADPLDTGNMTFAAKKTDFKSPRDAIQAGIGFCSEDRKLEGIIPEMSVRENLTLALLPQLAKLGVLDTKKQNQIVNDYIQRLNIKTSSPEQPIRELSGGNQQKVLLARWLCMNPKLLILDEPTRGIDVGAKGEIQRLIQNLAGSGLAVLMISSEIEELSEGCDKVIVMRDGKSIAKLQGNTNTQAAIMSAMANASGVDS